jgi:hypothetical protein
LCREESASRQPITHGLPVFVTLNVAFVAVDAQFEQRARESSFGRLV